MAATQQSAVIDVVQNINAMHDPCEAYKVLQKSLAAYRQTGSEIPVALQQMEKDLSRECLLESQGR